MATQDLAVRLKRKASPDDTDMGEGDASGVVVPSAQPNPRPVSDEPSKKRLRLDEELAALEDEAAEEGVLAEVTKQGRAHLPKISGAAVKENESKYIGKKWTPGWLQHFDAANRPKDLSRNFIHHMVVMSTHMSIVDARDGLRKLAKGNRPFGPADVEKVCCAFLGRSWASLKSEAFRKKAAEESAAADQSATAGESAAADGPAAGDESAATDTENTHG